MEMPNPNSPTCHNGPLNLIPWNRSATTVTVVPVLLPAERRSYAKHIFLTHTLFEIGRIIAYFPSGIYHQKVKVVAVIIPHKEAHIIM